MSNFGPSDPYGSARQITGTVAPGRVDVTNVTKTPAKKKSSKKSTAAAATPASIPVAQGVSNSQPASQSGPAGQAGYYDSQGTFHPAPGIGSSNAGTAPDIGHLPTQGQQRGYFDDQGVWHQAGPSPIGVSPDYVAHVPNPYAPATDRAVSPSRQAQEFGQPATMAVLPRYTAGMEYDIGAGLSRETIVDMQFALRDAGIMNPKSNMSGNWDTDMANAMRPILAQANMNGTDWQTQFATSVTTAIQTAPGGQGYLDENGKLINDSSLPVRPAYPVTNPADLRSIARQVSEQVLGRTLPDDYIDGFVNNYQAMESAYNEAQYQGQLANAQGTDAGPIVAPPSQANAATDYIKGDWGNEAQAWQMVKTFNDFQSILKGPFG